MKNMLLNLLVALFFLQSCSSEKFEYSIEGIWSEQSVFSKKAGKYVFVKPEKVYMYELTYENGDIKTGPVLKKVPVENGRFVIKGKSDKKKIVCLGGLQMYEVLCILEPGTLHVNLDDRGVYDADYVGGTCWGTPLNDVVNDWKKDSYYYMETDVYQREITGLKVRGYSEEVFKEMEGQIQIRLQYKILQYHYLRNKGSLPGVLLCRFLLYEGGQKEIYSQAAPIDLQDPVVQYFGKKDENSQNDMECLIEGIEIDEGLVDEIVNRIASEICK